MKHVAKFFQAPAPANEPDKAGEERHQAYIQGASMALAIRSLMAQEIGSAVLYGMIFAASEHLSKFTYLYREEIYRTGTKIARDAFDYIKRTASDMMNPKAASKKK